MWRCRNITAEILKIMVFLNALYHAIHVSSKFILNIFILKKAFRYGFDFLPRSRQRFNLNWGILIALSDILWSYYIFCCCSWWNVNIPRVETPLSLLPVFHSFSLFSALKSCIEHVAAEINRIYFANIALNVPSIKSIFDGENIVINNLKF